jgi:hypothetical protein
MRFERLQMVALSTVLALVVLAAAPGPLLAQEPSLPAAIHQGTCQQPTEQPAFTAGGVTPFKKDGQPVTQQDIQGRLTLAPVLTTTETTVNTKLDDLLDPANPYVFAIHASAEDFATIVACGEIGGPVLNDQLVIALRPIANSGYAGIALLTRDGDNTKTNVYLMSDVGALSGQAAAPPAAATPTPIAGAPVVQPTPTVASTATLAPTPTMATTPTPTPTPGG